MTGHNHLLKTALKPLRYKAGSGRRCGSTSLLNSKNRV